MTGVIDLLVIKYHCGGVVNKVNDVQRWRATVQVDDISHSTSRWHTVIRTHRPSDSAFNICLYL